MTVFCRRAWNGPRRLALLLAFSLSAAACADQSAVATLRIATTTSVDNSGLLAAILPAFERRAHLKVEVLAVGSGQAFGLLERGDVVAGLTHDPQAEAAALAAGLITGYRKIMFNDFIIVGPPEDVAGVAAAANAVDAMQRIASAGAAFASRGDRSGTHSREQELWALARQRPVRELLIETGQGMSATLRVASEKRAYTLTDRATFEQIRSGLRLAALCEDGSALLNSYAVFLRARLTATERAAATTLADWLADGEGRQLVAGFLTNGQTMFTVWPAGMARTRPTDRPDAR
ncbi:MAG: substrate-binding domain-containing protein [Acidobacteriota bacterium]